MTTYYTKEHEWLQQNDDGTYTVGITTYAQEQLGDVVFVEVPENPLTVDAGDEAATVESVKAASEVYAPVAGDITEGNMALVEEPSLVNSDPEGDGWFFKMTVSDESELAALMDGGEYKAYIADL